MSRLPSPESTLAIIFGADRYTHESDFDNLAFGHSARALRTYLLGDGFGMPRANLLYLFNSRLLPSTQHERMRHHIEANKLARDLIIYYVGHGQPRHNAYFLTVKSTRRNSLHASAIIADGIAELLKDVFRNGRTYIVLDACFAGEAVDAFQAPMDELTRKHVEDKLPPSGTALLAASSATDAATAPRDQKLTTFTTAITGALSEGIPTAGARFSLNELAEDAQRRIANLPSVAARPEVHAPKQRRGNIANTPLFRNRTPRANRISLAAAFTGPVRDDRTFSNSYHFESIHLFSALGHLPANGNVKIALVAGLPDLTHEALTDASVEVLDLGGSPVPDAHTTAMSALIVAPGDPAAFMGAAPGFDLVVLNILKDHGTVFSDILLALNKTVDLQPSVLVLPLEFQGRDELGSVLEQTFSIMLSHDVLIVASAGNSGVDQASMPSAVANCIAVGALSSDGQPSDFTNFGRDVDIFAPGDDLTVPLLNEGYGGMSGTSVSAALAGGVAAVIRASNPKLSAGDISRVLAGSAAPIHATEKKYHGRLGNGRLDAMAALMRATQLSREVS